MCVVGDDKLFAASHAMKGDSGINGSRGGTLCDVLHDEGSERKCAWRQIYPLLSP